MGLLKKDDDIFLDRINFLVKNNGNINSDNSYTLHRFLNKNPDGNKKLMDRYIERYRDYEGDVTHIVTAFLKYANVRYFLDLEGSDSFPSDFWLKSAIKVSTVNTHISIETREILCCLGKIYCTNEERLNILSSLINDRDEWAEIEFSLYYVISTILNDGLYPQDQMEKGSAITKKVVQKMIAKYTSETCNFIDLDSTHGKIWGFVKKGYFPFIDRAIYNVVDCKSPTELEENVGLLLGYGKLCIQKNLDHQLALQALTTVELINQKYKKNWMHSENDNGTSIYPYPEIRYIWSQNPLGLKGREDEICQISSNELAELKYHLGSNYELFAENIDDYQQVVTYYKAAANSGYPKAMFSLAKTYYSGLNIAPKNEQNAKYWLKKAIDADVVEALQFLEEHPELKEDGVKNISYHAEGDIFQGNVGVHATGNAVVNRATVNADSISPNSQEYKYCMYCGEKLPITAMFCMKCGKKV